MNSTCIASVIRIIELSRFVPMDATYTQGMGSIRSIAVQLTFPVS